MDPWFILISIVIVILVGFLTTHTNKQVRDETAKKEKLRAVVDSQKGFKSSHYIVKISDSLQYIPTGIAIDDTAKKICLILGDTLRIIGYDELIESEVIVDGASVTKTSRASQFMGTAIGAVLAGGIGAIIGGLSGSTSTSNQKKIKGVSLKLIINDTSNPIHLVDFIEENFKTEKTIPKIALEEAKSWHDLLSVILKQAEESKPTNAGSFSAADEIQKYSELHKSGALSDDEFAEAKKKVLEK